MHALICRESVGGSRRERELKYRCFIPRISYPQMIRCSHGKMPPKYQLNSDVPGTQLLPTSLNLSKNFSYTMGEEGWGLKDRGGKGRGLKDGSSKARSWGRSSTQGCGEESNRGPDIATCFSPGSFLSKPNLIGDHDKDTIRTIKRLPFYIFFPQFTLLPTPSSKCPVLPTHKQGNHRRGCLQCEGEKPAGITSIWPGLIRDLGLSA